MSCTLNLVCGRESDNLSIGVEKLNELLKSWCYELSNSWDYYLFSRNILISEFEDMKCGTNYSLDSITKFVYEFRVAKIKYNQKYVMVSQFVHVLGGDYLEFFESFCEKADIGRLQNEIKVEEKSD